MLSLDIFIGSDFVTIFLAIVLPFSFLVVFMLNLRGLLNSFSELNPILFQI